MGVAIKIFDLLFFITIYLSYKNNTFNCYHSRLNRYHYTGFGGMSKQYRQKYCRLCWKATEMLRVLYGNNRISQGCSGFLCVRCGERVVVRFRRWGWCLESERWCSGERCCMETTKKPHQVKLNLSNFYFLEPTRRIQNFF